MAFFGGSFDPPHLGHLAIARAAREALRLDRVLFAPVGAQPLKPAGSTASFPERVAMTQLAIAGDPGFEISMADAPGAEGKPNYTIDTLGEIWSDLSDQSCLFCLMGADSFATLRKWHHAAEIPFAASLIVASRPGQELKDLAGFLPAGLTLEPQQRAAEEHGRVELRSYVVRNAARDEAPFYLLPGLDVEISASDIRAQIRNTVEGLAASSSLPPAVAEYIRSHGLYRG